MASTALTDAIADTAAEVARSTTTILRHATFLRLGTEPNIGIVDLAGGEVEANLNGVEPVAGEVLVLLQQGYELLAIGPLTSVGKDEVAIQSTAPTDPDLRLWVQI
jgi:hypothetical protein